MDFARAFACLSLCLVTLRASLFSLGQLGAPGLVRQHFCPYAYSLDFPVLFLRPC